jgi:hypothetical protein
VDVLCIWGNEFAVLQKKLSYKCACCGNEYDGSPSFAYDKPTYYFDVPETERPSRVKIDSDLCHIRNHDENADDDIYAIRVTLDVPIHGVEHPFCWGVWVTQSKDNFYKYIETYDNDQSNTVTFGWLAVTMSHYDRRGAGNETEHLACDVHWGVNGERPSIILHRSDHPLFRDQQNGISWDEAVTIARAFLKTVH